MNLELMAQAEEEGPAILEALDFVRDNSLYFLVPVGVACFFISAIIAGKHPYDLSTEIRRYRKT